MTQLSVSSTQAITAATGPGGLPVCPADGEVRMPSYHPPQLPGTSAAPQWLLLNPPILFLRDPQGAQLGEAEPTEEQGIGKMPQLLFLGLFPKERTLKLQGLTMKAFRAVLFSRRK